MININLVNSVPDKSIRKDIVRVYYGIVPCDGRTRSINGIMANLNRYKESDRDYIEKDSQKAKK